MRRKNHLEGDDIGIILDRDGGLTLLIPGEPWDETEEGLCTIATCLSWWLSAFPMEMAPILTRFQKWSDEIMLKAEAANG